MLLTNFITFGAGVNYAYSHSDFVGKSIVLILLLSSVCIWSYMILKGVSLCRAKKDSELFLEKFRNKKYALAIIADPHHIESPLSDVYTEGAAKVMDFCNLDAEQAMYYGSPNFPITKPLSAVELDAITSSLEQEVSQQILKLEGGISWLATAVSVSPFLGLFGTVYGVMLAFTSIAASGKPDIGGLAPGVSGALLTTVVALIVAIPSLIGYNLLTSSIRKLTVYMDNFVEEFIAKIKLDQLRNRN